MTAVNEQRTDQELVAAALVDPGSYDAIVARYQAPLLRYIFRLGCRSADDAQDILQEALIKAYVNLNDFDQKLKFSSWLYRIVHNETVSFFRRTSIRPQPPETEDQLAMLEALSDERNQEEETDAVLRSERLAVALGSLEPKYREPLVLKYLEELSYEEISDILRVPKGTVATLISRGKERFRKMMSSTRI